MVENVSMPKSDSDNGQMIENKIHIEWLVRHVQQIEKQQSKQTYLIYSILVTVISALIGGLITIL